MKFALLKILFTLLFSIFIGNIFSQLNVIVKLNNGSENYTPLNSVTKINFSNNFLELKNTSVVINSYLISDIQNIRFGTYSSVKQVISATDIYLFPNPATDYIRIKNLPTSNNHIIIFSHEGRKLKEFMSIDQTEDICVGELKAGVYLMLVNNTMLKFGKL